MSFGNCVQDIEQFHHSKNLSRIPLQLIPGSTFMSQTTYAFSHYVFFIFSRISYDGIKWYVYLVVCIPFLFLLIAEQYSITGIYHNFFIHSHIGEYLGYFQFLAIVDNTTVCIWYKSSCEHTFSFLLDKCLTVKLMDQSYV